MSDCFRKIESDGTASTRIYELIELTIYEIKSDPDPFVCVTKALGQICQYAYLYCRDSIEKMVIVGSSEAPLEVDKYLSWFRDKYSLQVYYLSV